MNEYKLFATFALAVGISIVSMLVGDRIRAVTLLECRKTALEQKVSIEAIEILCK